MDEFQTQEQVSQEPIAEPVQGTEPVNPVEEPSEPQQTQERTFTQADLDRIVSDRLGRERQKYTPYQSFVETEAKRNNMTPQQYLQAVEQQRQAEERQQYIDQGINPDLVNQLLEQHPDIQYAREMRSKQQQEQQFQGEANEFFQTFPDVDVNSISPEVFQLKAEKGLSLTDAYLRVNFSKIKTQSEQDVLRKLQGNAQSSPGSLGQGAEPPTTNIKSMSKNDFESIVQRVKRGEKIQI